MSTTSCSIGSICWPSISLMITSGRDTASSKPSRRMFSISTDRCSSPRPETRNLSGSEPSSTFSATLCSVSRSRRSRIWRLVRNLPPLWSLLPANGELLTWKVMVIVGSSTVSAGSASGVSSAQMVSEMLRSAMPEIATMSPASRFLDLDALQAHEAQHLQHLALALLAVAVDHADRPGWCAPCRAGCGRRRSGRRSCCSPAG